MKSRFAARREQLLADAEVDPALLRGVLPRLERFLDPFVASLQRSEQGQHARHYVAGLLSNLPDKNVESIAYLYDQQREPLQQFMGQSPWDHQPWLTELAQQVGQQLGSPDGILVFDPSAFPKKGEASVGVQRQWCGRLGKVDNCQVGIYLAYVGRTEQALVDVRLYLPKEWAKDKKRRAKAGVPRTTRFRTRHELALEMLDERGRYYHTPGFPAMMRWADPRGFASNCDRGTNAICWLCPRTRRCVSWWRPTRRTRAAANRRACRSRGWMVTARLSRRRGGKPSRSVPVREAR